MAKFNSIEELLALRPKTSSRQIVDNSTNNRQTVDSSTRDILSRTDLSPKTLCTLEPDHKIKGYKFKRVKNSACGWEVDYNAIAELPINKALTEHYLNNKKEQNDIS